jgi:transketolase
MATRAASGKVLNAIAGRLPNMIGGSADLAPSNKTIIADSRDYSAENRAGRNIRFGVREHGMAAIVNGMALHGGVIPYCGTFLVFSDYMRPSIRLAALMDTHSIFVFTHDSVAVGEDGPTHQPIEHLAALRAIPNLAVIRPAEANETSAAWKIAVECKKPVALILTRQKLPILDAKEFPVADGAAKGAYVLSDVDGKPDLLLIATGSEVSLAMSAKEKLTEKGIKARVISMPCQEIFSEQSQEYRNQVLPPDVTARIAVEAGSTMGWRRWVGDAGDVIGIETFGASAPGSLVMEKYGFNVDNVVARSLAVMEKSS